MIVRSAQIDDLVGGHTALHVACHQGHCDIIRELLERGADMDVLVGYNFFIIFLLLLLFFVPFKLLLVLHEEHNKETHERQA